MIRFLFRAAGFVLLAAAFASLVVDGTRSIAAEGLMQFSFGETAGWLGGQRFAQVMQAMAAWPLPAQELIRGLLAVPSWIVTGVLGLALLVAGRPPGPRIGFSSRGG